MATVSIHSHAESGSVNPALSPDHTVKAAGHQDGAISHMRQLDGIRALAVLGPLLSHFLPADHPANTVAPWGDMGVSLFFVISGFLITGILLRCKSFIESQGQNLGATLWRFYVRRFLRIIPLFYGALIVLAILGMGEVRQTALWHVFYLSNVGIVVNDGGFGQSTHFWSLAVEEQFYFVWPLLILLVPRRWLMPMIVLTIASASPFRFLMALLPISWHARRILPFACLDALAIGALIAVWRTGKRRPADTRWFFQMGLWVGAPLAALLILLEPLNPVGSALNVVFGRLVQSLFFAWLVNGAATGFPNAFGTLLSSRPATYIGRISYGIYVIHPVVPRALNMALGTADALHSLPLVGRLMVWSALTVGLASLSWRFFEQPINNLKSRFPYRVDQTFSTGTDREARLVAGI
jgi:peptidoglycan/LPS O-acetylase OafA/YrhL